MREAGEQRLIPRRLRGAVAAAAFAAAATTITLGAVYTGGSTAGRLDRALDSGFYSRVGRHHALTDALVSLGSPSVLAVLTILIVVVLLGLRRGRAVWLAALAPLVASAITEWGLKPLVERTRGGTLSYPSGHTTGIFAIALVVVVLLVLGSSSRRRLLAVRVAASVIALAAATAVAVATVAAGRHYVTDAVGGVGVAIATVITVALLVDSVADRRTCTAQP